MKQIKGLGDIIEFFTTITGIKYLVDKIWKGDCGCIRRRDILNEKFPLHK